MSVTINHQTNDISATGGSLTIDGSAVGGGSGPTVVKSTETSFADIGDYGFSMSHGQGSTPDQVFLQLLVKTDEDGWSTGDVINIYNVAEYDETDYQLNCYGNATNMGVQFNIKSDILLYYSVGPSASGGGNYTDQLLNDASHRYRLVGIWY